MWVWKNGCPSMINVIDVTLVDGPKERLDPTTTIYDGCSIDPSNYSHLWKCWPGVTNYTKNSSNYQRIQILSILKKTNASYNPIDWETFEQSKGPISSSNLVSKNNNVMISYLSRTPSFNYLLPNYFQLDHVS